MSDGKKVLVIDVGGTNVKLLVSGADEKRVFPSGPALTPQQMVAGVHSVIGDWTFDAVSIGFPAPVRNNRPTQEPVNLGKGWVTFDYEAALKKPVRMINDAAMQALGSYDGGRMLFLGLGTGLGNCMILDNVIAPMEIGHLPYRKRTFEDYVGVAGLERFGKRLWRKRVADVVARLKAALLPDYIVLGGGNAKKLKELPPTARLGSNENAFIGGFRLWQREQGYNDER
jgi:polyphosphate glucokinase